MKQILKSLCCVAAFAAMLAGFGSCDTSSRQHRGGGFEPETPVRPGEGSDNPYNVELLDGWGEFYGDYYETNTDNYLVYLYEGETDSDGYFTKSAHMLTLDILLPQSNTLGLREGLYSCSDRGASFTFSPAFMSKDKNGDPFLDGSKIYIQTDAKHYVEYGITDGKIEILKLIGNRYEMSITVSANGTEYNFHYKGAIDITDMTQGDNPQIDTGFPGSDTYQIKAKALYNGEVYDGSDDYSLYLYYGDYHDNGDFKTKGTEMVFEILTKIDGGKGIAAGRYTCTSTDQTPFHFLDGLEEDGTIYPSYIYRQYDNSGTNWSIELVKDGNIEISRSGSQYSIKAYFTTPSGSYTCQYEGPLEIIDNRQEEMPKNVVMNNITRVVAEDWGQVWDGIECTDYRDWILYFYDKDAESTKEYTSVEILTEKKYDKSLPEAVFSKLINPDVDKTSEFVPGVIIAGYSDSDQNAWGTWYCKGGTAWYAASKGSIDIKKSGDGYALDFDFVDEDETYGGTFKGGYTGKVEFTVASTQSAAARRTAGRDFSLQRGATAQRAVAAAGSAQRHGVGQGRKAAAPAAKTAPDVRRGRTVPKVK
ncbi:MAG: hypothetical protein J5577_06990 [Bacteroidales bacterium]|nr:hypothetical protein [Bacteroidales bacterium]MBR5053985.1 hypothetical protein [Bacteroidales bacterium]